MFLALCALVPAAAQASDVGSSLWYELSTLRKKAVEVDDEARLVKEFYESTLSGKLNSLPGQKETDLHDLFKVLDVAAMDASVADYASRPIYANGMAKVFDELGRRRIQTKHEVESYYEHLVARRDLKAAEGLRRSFRDIDLRDYTAFKTRSHVDTSKAAAYTLGEHDALELSTVNFPDDGNYVVIVIGCHFAVDAARVLMADERVSHVLAGERVFWILPDSTLSRHTVEEWNNQFPKFKAMVAYDNASWTGVDFSATPTFNYFHKGVVVETVNEWDSEEGHLEVTRSLERIGLLTRDDGARSELQVAGEDRG